MEISIGTQYQYDKISVLYIYSKILSKLSERSKNINNYGIDKNHIEHKTD